MGQLQSLEPTLRELGFQIVAISTDRPSELRKSVKRNSLTYTLLSDSTMAGAKAFGIAWRMDLKQVRKYKLGRMDIEAGSGQIHHILPVPSVFVLSTKGVIQFEYVNPNHRIRLDSNVLEEAARATMK
ncbi:MAG: redoxin domain-containing protein [Fidelibacterota bacterium]|nr:MAG: redoxin domain-containing protein [Candidatus Neomarinimicrobiota bacterium]